MRHVGMQGAALKYKVEAEAHKVAATLRIELPPLWPPRPAPHWPFKITCQLARSAVEISFRDRCATADTSGA